MTDNLRDRIAAALLDQHPVSKYGDEFVMGKAHWLADTVIAVVSNEYINSRGMFHEPDRCLGCEECND